MIYVIEPKQLSISQPEQRLNIVVGSEAKIPESINCVSFFAVPDELYDLWEQCGRKAEFREILCKGYQRVLESTVNEAGFQILTLYSSRGVSVNVIWCIACSANAPWMESFLEQLKQRGLDYFVEESE